MQATELRKGTTVFFRNELFIVTEFRHYTPGNKRAFVQATMKNLKTGKLLQNKFASTEDVERAILDPKPCQYLYQDDQGFHFMDMESYNTIILSADAVGDARHYLKENMELKIDFFQGEPALPELPKVVTLKVTESPPWIKGDSVSNNMKPAVCETGLKIQVPIFIDVGTDIKVNTDSGEYTGRA
ncbi:MAG: elongation factor P [Candidatus Omnitrophota bacterium]